MGFTSPICGVGRAALHRPGGRKPEFSNTLKIGKGLIQYGAFVNTVINLVITGLVLFLIVKTYDTYQNRKRAAGEEGAGVEPDEQVMLLREIRDALVTRN